MLNVPGRSSGSWFVLLPAPSHLNSDERSVMGDERRALALFDLSLVTGHSSLSFRQWRWRVSSPFTAAGPRGICTLFPYPETTM